MLSSRFITLDEFYLFAPKIDGTDLLINHASTLCEKGIVRASFVNGECYSLQGVFNFNGNGNAWMISDKELLKRFPLTAYKSAKFCVNYALKEFNFEKITLLVPNSEHDIKWGKSLGFSNPIKVGDENLLLSLSK